jgi:hypothetical protein
MSSGLVGLVGPVVNDRIVIEVLYAAMRGFLSSCFTASLGFFFAAAAKRQMNPTFVTTFTE